MKRHLQCAEQQSTPCNLTKYCACPAKGMSWLMCITYQTSFTMRGATGINLQPHQICACHAKLHSQILEKFAENSWSGISNKRPIRAWSDPGNANRNPPRHRGYFSHSPGADSIENYNVSRSGYHSKFHHMLRLPRKVTRELLQMLRLPRKVTHELHQMLYLLQKVTHELHQMLHLPQ